MSACIPCSILTLYIYITQLYLHLIKHHALKTHLKVGPQFYALLTYGITWVWRQTKTFCSLQESNPGHPPSSLLNVHT